METAQNDTSFMKREDNCTERFLLSATIKAEATRLGFDACGIAEARPVDAATVEAYRQWIGRGRHGAMEYMSRYEQIRFNPTLLMPRCHTIVSLALNYYPARRIADDRPQFAYYAYGKDYHDVMKARIRELAKAVYGASDYSDYSEYSEYSDSNESRQSRAAEGGSQYRVAVDSAPILERYWATQAGIGWIGRNKNFIIPRHGSFYVLGELLLTDAVDRYDMPMPNHCGTCTRCIDACPTGALSDKGVDASRCLSYLTIEHRGAFSAEQESLVRSQPTPYYIYGCDRCQRACPHNRFATPCDTAEFQPSDALLAMTAERWAQLTPEQYWELFRGSPVKRAKYEGLMRNIETLNQE